MKCPECGHDFDDESIQCSFCGKQSLTWGELKWRENYEFLLAWLEDKTSLLGSSALSQLRDAAKHEFESLRESLVEKPRKDSAEMISDKPPREPLSQDEIDYLRGVEAVLDLLPGWVQRGWLENSISKAILDFLAQKAKAMRERHSDPQVTLEAMSEDTVIGFIIKQLPSWRKNAEISHDFPYSYSRKKTICLE